jgi:two-component system response regulator HydG
MQGTFRRDLYCRLKLLSLRIPALRERRQDIPPLIVHFLERTVRDSGQKKSFSGEALKAMLAYDWPGNVRELENCVESTCAFTSGPLIYTADLPREIANFSNPETSNGNGHAGKIIPIAELEKQTILSAVAALSGDKMRAARLLGIGRTTLYRKLKHYVSQS